MSDLLEYKCPACGGALEFDTETQKLKCPYCESSFDVEELQEQDKVLDQAENESAWAMPNNQWTNDETAGMSVYICNSCGGEIVGDSTLGATSCPYCGNPVVMSGAFQGALKPDYIIPFKLDKAAAKERYNNHVKGKFLLPKLFKDQNHIDEIKGVYVPFWLYDSDISANATFKAENVRTWSDSKYNYTETSIYSVYREGRMQFYNIPCDGSSKMDDDLMESIEPFDFSEAVPFQSAYLAGFFADKYDVDEKQNAQRANDRILNSAIEVLEDTFKYNYTSVQAPNASTAFANGVMDGVTPHANMSVLNGTVKYALYPVWLLTSTYKGEKYTFAMNGQTGKFVGNLPADKTKSGVLFGASFAAFSAIATALIYLFMG